MLSINNVTKTFGSKCILENVNMVVKEGESVVIVGPSGSGKSVLLRIIMGLTKPTTGNVSIDGNPISVSGLDQCNRKIGFMFQECALFDSMNVYENVRFYLDYHDIGTEKERDEITMSCLGQVSLESASKMNVSDLSGGMIKRVAIARLLACKPNIMIFDEPTSGLDDDMAKKIVNAIKEILIKHSHTCIIVTHDKHCADILGKRIFVKHGTKLIEKAIPVCKKALCIQGV